MTTICWTIVHNVPAPLTHAGKAIRRVGHFIHHLARHRVHRIVPRTGAWVEVVCKVVVIGGGTLIPRPALPPPPAVPVVWPASPGETPLPTGPPGWVIPGGTGSGFAPPASPPGEVIRGGGQRGLQSAPEPSTVALLGVSAGAAVLVRRWRRGA
jgi:hypothetical protein